MRERMQHGGRSTRATMEERGQSQRATPEIALESVSKNNELIKKYRFVFIKKLLYICSLK